MDARRPARRQAGDQRADRRRGVERPERGAAEASGGERREQRQRHPEDHRHEVDDVGADQLLAAARVAEALDDRAPGRRLGVVARRHRAHRDEAGERGEEAGGVDAEGRDGAGRPDQDAADRRPDDHAEAAAEGAQRRRRGNLVGRNQPRRHGVERRPLQAVEGRHQPGGEVEHGRPTAPARAALAISARQPAIRPISVAITSRRRSIQSASAPPTNAVSSSGTSSTTPRIADREAGAGQGVHLPGQRHVGDHRAQERHGLGGVEEPEVAAAERAQVHGQRRR